MVAGGGKCVRIMRKVTVYPSIAPHHTHTHWSLYVSFPCARCQVRKGACSPHVLATSPPSLSHPYRLQLNASACAPLLWFGLVFTPPSPPSLVMLTPMGAGRLGKLKPAKPPLAALSWGWRGGEGRGGEGGNEVHGELGVEVWIVESRRGCLLGRYSRCVIHKFKWNSSTQSTLIAPAGCADSMLNAAPRRPTPPPAATQLPAGRSRRNRPTPRAQSPHTLAHACACHTAAPQT